MEGKKLFKLALLSKKKDCPEFINPSETCPELINPSENLSVSKKFIRTSSEIDHFQSILFQQYFYHDDMINGKSVALS